MLLAVLQRQYGRARAAAGRVPEDMVSVVNQFHVYYNIVIINHENSLQDRTIF